MGKAKRRQKPKQAEAPVAPSDPDVSESVPDINWVSFKEDLNPQKAVIGIDAPRQFINDMVSDTTTWDHPGVDQAMRRAISQAIGIQCIPHHLMAQRFRKHISDWCKRIAVHLETVTKPDIMSMFAKLKECINSIIVLGKKTDRVEELGSFLEHPREQGR